MPVRAEGGSVSSTVNEVLHPDRVDDGGANILGLFQHLVIPNSQDFPAKSFQSSRSCLIIADGVVLTVSGAIDFDDKFVCWASEVHDVSRDRHLASKA